MIHRVFQLTGLRRAALLGLGALLLGVLIGLAGLRAARRTYQAPPPANPHALR